MKNNRPITMLLLILIAVAFACRLPGSRQEGASETAGETTEPTPESTIENEPSQPQPATQMDRYTIVQENHPEALCNDGTTPVFYYRSGVGDGADKWIIWFKGGGTGYSAETFRNRGPSVTSSNPWMTPEFDQLGSGGNAGSPDGEAGGIMSSVPEENPDFYNWNHVYLVYCSSDGWTGTRKASEETGGIHFAGHHIVNAMFDALRDPDVVGSPNLSNAAQIILSGSSAGAQGLRSNIDRLAAMLSYADVRSISDAGVFYFNNPDMEEAFQTTTREQYEIWQSILDEDCVSDNSSTPWSCLSGGLLVQNGYIQTPMFIHQDQSDIKLQEALEATGVDVELGLQLSGESTRPLLETQEGVFSPIAGRHILLNTNRFNGFRLERMTFAEVFGNWYFNRPGPTKLIEYP